MNTRPNNSRERILKVAEALVLQQGFAGTSIEDVLKGASITKGGFFYHFKGKAELAQALVERYLDQDEVIFGGLFKRADELSEDPLQQLLIFLKLLAEMMAELETTHPGCLVAGFSYENKQFNNDVRELMKQGIVSWRVMIAQRLKAVLKNNPANLMMGRNANADGARIQILPLSMSRWDRFK